VSVTVSSRLLGGMNRTATQWSAGVAVLVAVSGLGLTTTPATAATRVETHLARAHRGPAPHVLLMEGRTLNRANGSSLRVRMSRPASIYWSLVGRSPGGYVLARYDTHLHLDLYRLSHGTRHLLARTGGTPEDEQVLGGPGGRRTASWSPTPTAETSVGKVFGPDGTLVAQTKVSGDSQMLAFDGKHVVFSGSGTTLWTLGSTPTTISSDRAVLASFDHDLLFLHVSAGEIGATSLSAPGSPSWTAPFTPTQVSADGRLVVGDVTGRSDRVQVRRVSDGHVVADLAVRGHANGQPLVLEGNHHVLLQARVPHRGLSLFRCGFTGHCVRTWSWLSASIFAGWHFSGPGFGTGFET
jgi:hypothetical protein